MWPQEAELLFGPYTSLNFESKQDIGPKSFIKLRVSISTNRPSLEGLGLDDCNITPPWTDSAGNFKYYGMSTIEEARNYDTGMVRGSLQVKVEGRLRDSWVRADCEYDSATHEFSSTDSKGKQQRVANCWVVDVPNSFGAKQHRFDVHSVVSYTQGTLVALAAAEGAEKQRWLAMMEAGTVAAHTAGVSGGSSRCTHSSSSRSSSSSSSISRCRYSSCAYYRCE
jgi:hypothetical protein